MRRIIPILLMLAAVACGGESAPPGSTVPTTTPAPASTSTTAAATTTTSSTTTTSTTTTTTTTTIPPEPPIASEGDRGPIVSALQFALDCAGFGPLAADGAFGPATRSAVEEAQRSRGLEATGEATESLFADLSRSCAVARPLAFPAGSSSLRAAGNAAAGDDDLFTLRVYRLQTITVEAEGGAPVEVIVEDGTGAVLGRSYDDGAVSVAVDRTGDLTLRVGAVDPVTFTIAVEVPPPDVDAADVVLRNDGLGLAAFDDPADEAIAFLTFALGAPAADGGWVEDDACSGGSHRRVRWAIDPPDGGVATILEVHLTDYRRDARLFADYRYLRDPGTTEPNGARGLLSTIEGLTVGSSTAALEAVFPDTNYLYRDGEVTADTGRLPRYWIEPAIPVGPDTDLDNLPGWIATIGMTEDGCPAP
jgi:peptidoglycan hydrolase-like protein with peptidoglycan-binding domain